MDSPKFTFRTLQLLSAAVARFKSNKMLRAQMNKVLRADEIRKIKTVFRRYQVSPTQDKIELWDLRKVLKEAEVTVDEEELIRLAQHELKDNSGYVDMNTFLRIVINQKKLDKPVHDDETVLAFIAMGGNPDKSGVVSQENLQKVCSEFGFTIDIDNLLSEIDEDGNGTVDFDEFSKLLYE